MKKINLFLSGIVVGLLLFSDLSFAQGKCNFIGSLRNNPKSSELKNLEAERLLGRLCNPTASLCSEGYIPLSTLLEMGFSKNDKTLEELLNTGFVIWVSKVDIDNDGVDEIRIFSTVGTARCTRSYFYKQDKATGKLQPIADAGYAMLSEEARFCDGNLSFIRFQGKVFVLEAYDTIDTVWLGSERGLQQQCTFKKP